MQLDTSQKNLIQLLYTFIDKNSDAWKNGANLPNSLVYIVFGMDQAYYADFSKFDQVSPKDIENMITLLKEGDNLDKYASLVPIRKQKCGSCMAFATSAILTNFYIRSYYKSAKSNDTSLFANGSFFIEPYQLLSCANNQLPVDKKYNQEHEKLFPNSNGYYVGHACEGGMSPEMLFWAKYNTEKIGYENGVFDKVEGFTQSVNNDDIKLGKYCDKLNTVVGKLEGKYIRFPNFNIKYINKNAIFKGLNKRKIAETFLKLIEKYGFIFASAYSPQHNYFTCNMPDNMKESLITHHYVVVAGVKYVKGNSEAESNYFLLIHNSWGAKSYDLAPISDGYVNCNLLNGLFVIE